MLILLNSQLRLIKNRGLNVAALLFVCGFINSSAYVHADDAKDEVSGPKTADTLLWQGVEHLNLKTVEVALKRKANINATFAMFGDRPIIWRILDDVKKNSANAKEIMLFLLSKGADPNVAGFAGRRPLQRAIEEFPEKVEVIEALLKAKADVNLADDDGNTSLHSAVMQYDTEIVKLILKNSAKPNLKNKKGYTALDLAILNFNSQHILALQEAGGVFSHTENELYNYRSWTKNDVRFGAFIFAKSMLYSEAAKNSEAAKTSEATDTQFVFVGDQTKAKLIMFGEPQKLRITLVDEKNKSIEADIKPFRFQRSGSQLSAFFNIKIPSSIFRVRVDVETLDKKPLTKLYKDPFLPIAHHEETSSTKK